MVKVVLEFEIKDLINIPLLVKVGDELIEGEIQEIRKTNCKFVSQGKTKWIPEKELEVVDILNFR